LTEIINTEIALTVVRVRMLMQWRWTQADTAVLSQLERPQVWRC